MANPSFSLNFSRLSSSFIVSMDSAFVSFPVKISSLVLPNLYGKFLRVSLEIDLRAEFTSYKEVLWGSIPLCINNLRAKFSIYIT